MGVHNGCSACVLHHEDMFVEQLLGTSFSGVFLVMLLLLTIHQLTAAIAVQLLHLMMRNYGANEEGIFYIRFWEVLTTSSRPVYCECVRLMGVWKDPAL